MRVLSRVVNVAALLAIGLFGNATRAQETTASREKPAKPIPAPSADVAAIRAGSQAFVEAVNKQDAKGVAALWIKDGEYVDDAGDVYRGRDAIAKYYAELFAAYPKSRLRIIVDSVRVLSDAAAIEDGRAYLDPPPEGAPGISKYSVVHVKVDGKWLMGSVRDTWLEAPSTYQNVADLEWLIGHWVAEENGGKMESDCKWIANKSFVERSYVVKKADGSSTSGLQIIGWNPEAKQMQSWNFSSDGGHAIGMWSPQEKGWEAQIRGMTGEGVPTSAVNRLTKLDDNAYAWQSVERRVGDQELPDTDEIILKRTAPQP